MTNIKMPVEIRSAKLTPSFQSMTEPAINSLWANTGMVQMENVFLSLKPPTAVIKHPILIKIPCFLVQDVQVYMIVTEM